MEALYAKLYDKYNTLKKKKFSTLDEVNKDQEEKFLNYVSAAEDLIQHLREENDKLKAQVNELRIEVVSIRSSKHERCEEYQKLFMEEKQKNKMLCEEVERLHNSLSSKDGKNGNVLESPHAMSGNLYSSSERRITRQRRREAEAEMENAVITHDLISPDDSNVRTTRKRSREDQAEMGGVITDDPTNRDERTKRKRRRGAENEVEEAVITCRSIDHNDSRVRKSVKHTDISNDQQQECYERTFDGSGSSNVSESAHTNCQFQALVEYLVGMKLSAINQVEGICVLALHQSSGYSFTLTWKKKAAEDEPELLYRVLTLGTFERIAPEWMRSHIMFSMSMCPIFFERVARVIKLHR